jgi:hypothetical protein
VDCSAEVGSRGLDIEPGPEEIHHRFPGRHFVARLESEKLDDVGGPPVAPGVRNDGVPVDSNLEAPAKIRCTADARYGS